MWYLIALAISAVLIMVGAWAMVQLTTQSVEALTFQKALFISYLSVTILLLVVFLSSIIEPAEGWVGKYAVTLYFVWRWRGFRRVIEPRQEEDERGKRIRVSVILGMTGFTLLAVSFVIFL